LGEEILNRNNFESITFNLHVGPSQISLGDMRLLVAWIWLLINASSRLKTLVLKLEQLDGTDRPFSHGIPWYAGLVEMLNQELQVVGRRLDDGSNGASARVWVWERKGNFLLWQMSTYLLKRITNSPDLDDIIGGFSVFGGYDPHSVVQQNRE
jgi:hypothetical protein